MMPITFVPHTDYDNYQVFNHVLDAVKSLGYVDSSYGNDTCPSIMLELPNGHWQQVWIDYASLELREDPKWPMFSVTVFDENGNETARAEFDDANELIARLKGKELDQ
tara:strand:+ start:171 stop:494 length:324 start_codon:yes stop_codon:yes gene_type:complete